MYIEDDFYDITHGWVGKNTIREGEARALDIVWLRISRFIA